MFSSCCVSLIFLFLTNHFAFRFCIKSPKTSRQQLPTDTKNKLIGAVEAGESVAQAACRYDIKEDTARSIIKKYKVTGSTENLLCSGRPPKLTDADKRHIVQTARK